MAESNEWELSKENVLPLKRGRMVSSLIVGLQPTAEHTAVIRRQKQAFENELKSYEGNDPLEVWIRYINWIEQTFPRGGKESPFQDVIQRCIALFQHDECYKNDPRYLGVWIKMASFTKEPCEICKYLYDNKIGYKLASLYEAWASELERMGNTKKADQIYQCGIENGAEPMELLNQRRSELHARVARRVAGEIVAPPNPVLVVEEPCRSALGALKGRGSKSKAPVDRSVTTVQHRTERQQTSNIPQSHQSPFCILNDENVDPDIIPQPTGEWGDIPTNVIHKENDQKAGVWNKAKLKQKNKTVVPLNEISSVVEPPFTIYVEESQPTSSKQPDRNQRNELNQIVMYPKNKVYVDGKEYQLEEIRAASWEKRYQREEEKRLRQAIKEDLEMIRKEKEILLQYMAEMKQQIQQKCQDKAQCKLETQQTIEAARNQIQQHTASISAKKQELNRTLDLSRRELDSNRMALCPLEVSTVDSTSDLLGLNYLKEKENQMLNATQNISAYNLNQTESTGSLNKDNIVNTSSIPQTTRESNNSMKNSEPSTPSLDFKIINPSPTLNTKQALSVVLDMFNQPMMTAEQSGLEYTHSEDKESEKDTSTSANKPHQFKIFEESDEDSKPPKRSAGFVIYEDKENSDPPESRKSQRTNDASLFEPVATTKSSLTSNSSMSMENRKTASDLPRENVRLSEKIPLKQTKDVSYSCKESRMPESQSLGMSEHQPASHSGLIFDDISMINDPSLRLERKLELDGEELMEVNEANFTPSVTSTMNFTKALSMVSAPFHPAGEEAPLPSLSSDNINSKSASADNLSNKENRDTSQDHPDKMANRRSSMFVDWKGLENELSPIIECSDEDAKAMCSTNTTNDYPNSTVPVSKHPHFVSKSSDVTTTTVSRKSESRNTNCNRSSSCQQKLSSSCHHEIDVTNYEPPDPDEINDMLNMSVAINPNNPFDPDLIEHFLSKVDRPLREQPNCHMFSECMPDIIVGKQLNLGKHNYNIKKCFGKGSFAKIYLVERYQMQRNKHLEVMKVQKPACFWEFYICSELKARLQKLNPDRDALQGVMSITEGYFFTDGSCMTNAYSPHGTLLDVVNVLQKKEVVLDDGVFLVLVIDLLYIIEMMHKCHIIHGDIKPDNVLFTYPLDDDFIRTKGKRPLYVKLIDFGQSIDMKMFPEGTTFTASVETSGFKCIEMKTNRPWTYQTDLFGFVGTIYVLYHHQYMKVYQAGGQWKTTKLFRRSFVARDLLQKIILDMFSIPSCNDIPDLSQYRQQLEEILLDNFTLSDLSISFRQLKEIIEAK